MKDDKIAWEPHPVSPERKAELRAQGYRIIDARFAPEGALTPAAEAEEAGVGIDTNGDGKVSVAELRAALAERGIEVPTGAKKADLQALLDAAG